MSASYYEVAQLVELTDRRSWYRRPRLQKDPNAASVDIQGKKGSVMGCELVAARSNRDIYGRYRTGGDVKNGGACSVEAM